MSMSQFRNPKLYKIIDECLERHHVPPNKIKMEITERVVLNDMKYMKQLMKSFTSKGLRFCMDDFGTGYSNFANIMYLPFELIKLDRSLIEEITSSQRNRQAVQSMMGMFHAMDLKIVSEGIETEEQQKVLRDMGTDYIQGFVTSLGVSNPFTFVVAFVGVQGLIEAIVCFILAGAISRALSAALHRI